MECLDCGITILFHPITLPQTKTFAYETPIIYYQFAHHYFFCPDQLWTYRKHCSKKHDGHYSFVGKFRRNNHISLSIAQASPKVRGRRVIIDLTFAISNFKSLVRFYHRLNFFLQLFFRERLFKEFVITCSVVHKKTGGHSP